MQDVEKYFQIEIFSRISEPYNLHLDQLPDPNQSLDKYSSNEVTYACWNCFQYLERNQELIPSQLCQTHYHLMSKSEAEKIFCESNNYKFVQKICSIINRGSGVIFLGIRSAPYNPQLNQRGLRKQKFAQRNPDFYTNFLQIKQNLQQSINDSMHKRYKYQVEGVQIKSKIQQNRSYLNEVLKEFLQKKMHPKHGASQYQWQKIFIENDQLPQKQKYINISYIPVLQNKRKSVKQSDQEDKGLYVIRIALNFPQLQNSNKAYFFQYKSLDPDDKFKYRFAKQKENNSQQCLLQVEQIYNYIHTKYQRKQRQKKRLKGGHSTNKFMRNHHYLKKCYPPLYLQDHEYIEKMPTTQINEEKSIKKNTSKVPQKQKYYNKVPQKVRVEDFPYVDSKEQQDKGRIHNFSVPKLIKIESNFENSMPRQFGQQPSWIFTHGSILIVSKQNKESELKLQSFLQELNTKKLGHYCYQIYEKVKAKTQKRFFFVNSSIKYKELNQIILKINKHSRVLELLDIRKQFSLKNANNESSAIAELQTPFKLLFGMDATFKVGKIEEYNDKKSINQQIIYFIFEDKIESVFSFIVIESLNMRCQFVNNVKVQNLPLLKIF